MGEIGRISGSGGGFTILYRRNIPPSSGLIQKSRNDSDQKRWFLEDSIFAIIVFSKIPHSRPHSVIWPDCILNAKVDVPRNSSLRSFLIPVL